MKKHEHLPFEVILSATEGDPEAIETVMKFYDGYISKLCLRKLYDEYLSLIHIFHTFNVFFHQRNVFLFGMEN